MANGDPVTVGELERQLKRSSEGIEKKIDTIFIKFDEKERQDRSRDIKIAKQKQRCDDIQNGKDDIQDTKNHGWLVIGLIVGWCLTIAGLYISLMN